MIIILLVAFDVRWRLLPLGVVLVGCVWAFGLAGSLGSRLWVVTIPGLPVMLGVGIDYAIQMHSRIEEEVVIARAEHPIQEASVNLGPALLVVTFDAIFAFLALRFARVPMIRDFGVDTLSQFGQQRLPADLFSAAVEHDPLEPSVGIAHERNWIAARVREAATARTTSTGTARRRQRRPPRHSRRRPD